MKATTVKERILNAVLLAEHITGKKESLPVLSCILLDAHKELSIRATNLEAGIEVNIASEVEEVGSIAVPAAVLSQVLRSISGEKIQCKTEDGNLVVSSRGTRTLIKAVPHEEFPKLGALETSKKGISILTSELILGLRSVLYAASPSMIRPELGSIFVSIQDNAITCVATDSFRLAEKTIPTRGKQDTELLIPLKHCQEILHVLESVQSDTVELIADEAQLVITGNGTRYMSRIVEGTFPNYKEILPKKYETEATVLKTDFIEMLKRARVFSGNDQHVGLHVYPAKKIFSATARSAEVGEMSDSIDAALTGADLDINFHIGYLSDCLSSVESDSIILGFSGAGKAAVIRGTSDASFMYLVMPLNR